MSRTLFWYVFKDLLRYFLLASGALAGIMAFGGLLRPMTEQGLDVAQVGRMLGYLLPAMTTYSYPVAALFATTMVYGRLGADNELTACRAAGISFLSMALPALVLGLTVAIVSLVTLCFIVPVFWLKVERVAYSNLAELVAGQISKSHQIKFDQGNNPITVHARGARVLPEDSARPGEQVVELDGAMIVTFTRTAAPGDKNEKPLDVPENFFIAHTAVARITQPQDDSDVMLSAEIRGATKLSRQPGSGAGANLEGGISATTFGPVPLRSPIRDETKFMDVLRLHELLDHPEKSRNIHRILREFVRQDQQKQYLQALADPLNSASRSLHLETGSESYILTHGARPAELVEGRLVLSSGTEAPEVRFVQRRGGSLDVLARQVQLRALADTVNDRIVLTIEMIDADVRTGDAGSARQSFSRSLVIPMPEATRRIRQERGVGWYADARTGSYERQRELRRQWIKQYNSVVGEIHSRASFSMSCLILVMVGCALGMMFRSGNFLSAFAVSVAPALVCIALIVTGQHTAENIPWDVLRAGWTNPLQAGVLIIWSGNLVVAALAFTLLLRLQRR